MVATRGVVVAVGRGEGRTAVIARAPTHQAGLCAKAQPTWAVVEDLGARLGAFGAGAERDEEGTGLGTGLVWLSCTVTLGRARSGRGSGLSSE